MRDILAKLAYIFENMDGLSYFRKEKTSDHAKRNIYRRFFILLDDFIKFASYAKNKLARDRKITSEHKIAIEKALCIVKAQYDKQFEVIRDRLSAQHQPLDFNEIFYWWNAIDLTSIYVFHEDVKNISSKIANVCDLKLLKVKDYSPLDFTRTPIRDPQENEFFLSCDRLGLTKKQTAGMISCHPSQEKAQTISSIIDLLYVNCIVTCMVQDYRRLYHKIIFDTAWLLIICDLCSLLDNLYEDTRYGKSLIRYWEELQIKGLPHLQNGNASRDINFENDLRDIRIRLGAHIDAKSTMKNLMELFESFDLRLVHGYMTKHANVFFKGCSMDIRTRIFVRPGYKLNGMIVGMSPNFYRTFRA